MRAWRQRGPDRSARQVAEKRGHRAESLAVLWLGLKGYKILARRVKTPVGEIDLIARKGATLCFIEVKARDSLITALDAVTPTQRRRIGRAAQAWASLKPETQGKDWRFDVIVVLPRRFPHHLQDAWRPEA